MPTETKFDPSKLKNPFKMDDFESLSMDFERTKVQINLVKVSAVDVVLMALSWEKVCNDTKLVIHPMQPITQKGETALSQVKQYPDHPLSKLVVHECDELIKHLRHDSELRRVFLAACRNYEHGF